MKKLLLAALFFSAIGCAKDFGSSPDAGSFLIARFDPSQSPPIVPSPNDLAFNPDSGTLQIPVATNASDADKSLAAYLSTLDGYPADSPATMTFTGRLDGGSISATSVQTYDLTSGTLVPIAAATPSYADRFTFDATGNKIPDTAIPGEITVAPPASGWVSGHTYGIALIGGSNPGGVRGANGEEVIGSDSWALARSANSLVTCPAPYTDPGCRAATDLFPTVYIDPNQRIADQLATAIQLEAVRLHYKASLDQLAAKGFPRADVAQFFSFKIVDHAITPVFSLDSDQCKVSIPLPNDLAVNQTTGLLATPTPCPNLTAADNEFRTDYLNHLNGYPPDSVATAAIAGGNLGTAPVANAAGSGLLVLDLTAGNSAVSPSAVAYVPNANGSGTLQITPPGGAWSKGHDYGIALIGGPGELSGSMGEALIASDQFALLRSTASLVTCADLKTNCHATLTLVPVSDAEALQLEMVRLQLKPAFDALEAEGFKRATIAAFWSFKIESHTMNPVFILDPNPCNVMVPLPNDLASDPDAGVLATPVGCSYETPSESEFRADYLNHLNGYPTAAFASETFAGGNLATTGGGLVANGTNSGLEVFDLTTSAAAAPGVVSYTSASADGGTLSLAPPAGGWVEGHDYGVALVSGSGLVGSMGETVIASDQFAIVRSSNTLLNCDEDGGVDAGCHSAIIDAPIPDAEALQLEGVRLALKPGLDYLAAKGVARANVVAYWSFKITSNPEVTFDLLSQTIPFPNDGRDLSQFGQPFQLLIPNGQPDGGPRVNLPVPAGSPAAAAALIAGLNTLDGFSTTAPIVSENGYTTGALTGGALLDQGTLNGVGLFNLDSSGTAPTYQVCVSCALPSGELDAGAGEPQELEIVPLLPLTERTGYGAYITTALRSTTGVQVAPNVEFALLRMKNPIIDGSGQLTIPELDGALDLNDAAVLESLRQQYATLIDTVTTRTGIDRGHLALAWDFHTETTHSGLNAFAAIPLALETSSAGASVKPAYVYDGTATVKAQATAFNLGSVQTIYLAAIDTPEYFSDADGGYDPGANFDPAHEHTQRQQLVVTIPAGTPPAAGWPVAIFGHGFTRQRLDVLALANTFAAQGIATVAYDLPLHGDRSFCVGSHQAITLADGGPSTSDDDACFAGGHCVSDASDPSFGRCVSPARSSTGCTATTSALFLLATVTGQLTAAEGDLFCQAGGKQSGSTYSDNLGHCLTAGANAGYCEGSYFNEVDGTSPPVISGWDFVDPNNFFATRDHFRSTTLDINEVVEVIKSSGAGTLRASLTGNSALNPAALSYVGMSLGGLTGAEAVTVTPSLGNTVLNVTGGNLTGLLLRSPGLAILRTPTLAGLAALGIIPGQGNFDQFVNFAQWVLDPGDPLTFANHLADAPVHRKTLLQYIEGDTVVANFSSVQFIDVANFNPAAQNLVWDYYDDADYTLPYEPLPTTTNRHGFLLIPGANGPAGAAATTAAAQTEAATFVLTGASAKAHAGEVP